MSDKIYVIGHKSPDLDSVAAAIAYANLKNILEGTENYIPAAAGEVNKETAFALKKFGFSAPEVLENAQLKNIILVDHNEIAQSIDGMADANIIEVLDHHKVGFSYSQPIEFLVKPWGSSCSIITQLFFNKNVELNKNLAGLMLSAVLVDTVITKSPTTTEDDKKIIEKLAEIASIDSWQEFGMELFKVRSSVSELSNEEIIKSDFKDFIFKAGKIGVGQVETVDLEEMVKREDELITELNKIKVAENYHTVILFITDIIKEGSQFLVSTNDEDGFAKSFGKKLQNNRVYLDGIMSRKKQVIPVLTEIFDK